MFALAYFALGAAYFAPALFGDGVLYGTDSFAGGYAVYEHTARLIRAGELPAWIPYLYGGVPVYANPGSTFYPPHLLAAFVLPIGRAMALVMALQMAIAGAGMRALVRELDCRDSVAGIAGLAYALAGPQLSWVYGGHDGRIIVATWAPCVLALVFRAARTGRPRTLAALAVALGHVLASFQLQTAWYLLLACAAVVVFVLLELPRDSRLRHAGRVLAAGAYAFALAAIVLLPFLKYIPASSRGGDRGEGYATSFAASWIDLGGVAVPALAGASIVDPTTGDAPLPSYRGDNPFKLHSEYAGALTAVLLAIAVGLRRRWQAHARAATFFAVLGVFYVTLALGDHTPLYRVYWWMLPGLRRFRAPDLAMYMVVLCALVVASLALDRVLRLERRALLPGVAIVLGAGIGAALDASARTGWLQLAVGAGAILLVLAWAKNSAKLACIALVVCADQASHGRAYFYTARLPEADAIIEHLRSARGHPRVLVLDDANPRSNELMRFGIDQALGEHSTPVQRYLDYAQGFLSSPALRDGANIGMVIASERLDGPGIVPRATADGRVLHESTTALPRAYLVPQVVAVPSAEASLAAIRAADFDPRKTAIVEANQVFAMNGALSEWRVAVLERSETRVEVRVAADARAWLVVAETWLDDWTALVDGEPAAMLPTNHAFRGVSVPQGEHTVRFELRPRWLYAGFAISLASIAALLVLGVVSVVRRGQKR